MRTRWFKHAVTAALATATLASVDSAEAYSTRVHIVIANHVREALIAGDGQTIRLIGSESSVRLAEEDAQAIIENPLSFRAGAIGPDNMIFPGMTDPSHAVWQRPFEQCELLYKAAVNGEERAYALGCFLHGSTDAVAHHFVNYLAGETFTLTPLKTSRESDYTNVVRHIAVESMIEEAEVKADPNAFAPGTVTHSIPIGFVHRAYLNEQSPLYQLLSKRARERYQRARLARPGGLLHDILAISELEPADHLVLAPLYLDWVDESLSTMRGRFKSLQEWTTPDGSLLKAKAGPDGALGTSDDELACSVSCPKLAAEYSLFAHLMEPRKDAQGRPLPSAFDKVMGKLRSDLDGFVPAYLKTVDNFSSKLNTPYLAGQKRVDITLVDVDEVFRPLTEWSLSVGRIDYDVLARALIPDVWLDLWGHLRKLGITITPPEIMKILVGPYIEDLKNEVEKRIVEEAKTFIKDFTATYRAQYASAKAEYATRIAAASPDGAPLFDDLHASGLAAHTFNIAAAAIANRAVVLPVASNDPIGLGPASFDTSYSTHWMQAGVCEPIRARVFPYGLGVKGLFTMKKDGQVLAPRVTDEAPVECHDGSLSSFAANPNPAACQMVELPKLLSDTSHRGSITRGFPPEHAAQKPTCATGADVPSWLTLAGDGNGDGEDEEARRKRTTETTGCGCSTPGSKTMDHGAWAAAIAFVLYAMRRRRSLRPNLAGLLPLVPMVLALSAIGCMTTTTTEEEIDGEKKNGNGAPADDPNASPEGPGGLGGMDPQTLSAEAKALLAALGDSTWHGTGIRNGKKRVIEHVFRANRLQWGEVQNPFGPGRKRELRTFTLRPDASLHAVVTNAASWKDGTPNGREADYTLEVVPGSPRRLKVTTGDTVEELVEGPEPAPTSGFTATVRTFASAGPTDQAFCRRSYFSAIDYVTVFNFARYGRDKSAEHELGSDFVVGAKIAEWRDDSGANRFSVRDVPGFDRDGGTDMTDQQNFFVHYRADLVHPGGTFSMREMDDGVEDAVWSFVGPTATSNLPNDLFLEVHDRPYGDWTVDEPVKTFSPGKVPLEIFIARCGETIKVVTLQGKIGDGPWTTFDYVPTVPLLDPKLLQPPL